MLIKENNVLLLCRQILLRSTLLRSLVIITEFINLKSNQTVHNSGFLISQKFFADTKAEAGLMTILIEQRAPEAGHENPKIYYRSKRGTSIGRSPRIPHAILSDVSLTFHLTSALVVTQRIAGARDQGIRNTKSRSHSFVMLLNYL